MSRGRRIALMAIQTEITSEDAGAPVELTPAGPHYLPFNYGAYRVYASLVSPALPDAEVRLLEASASGIEGLWTQLERFSPDVIGCSAFVWSFPAFLEIARRAKACWPDCTVVFGGPSARPAMFSLEPFSAASRYVDVLVDGEGEEPMRAIATAPDRSLDSLARIPGLTVRSNTGWHTLPRPSPSHMDSLQSPYQLGLSPTGQTAHLETFRGCPLSCRFCEWGVQESANRVHSAEYLARELEALRRVANGGFLVDAGLNLNRRAFRNLAEAERQVRFFRDAPFSCEIYATSVTDEDIEFLSEVSVHRLGIGLQSFNQDVLKRHSRPYDERRFLRGVDMLSTVGGGAIEVILGLPWDTPESFRETIERALRLPASSIHIFHCLALPDGLMTRAPEGSDMVFDPYTLRMRSCTGWSERDLAETAEWCQRRAEQSQGFWCDAYWSLPIRDSARQTHVAAPPREAERTPAPDGPRAIDAELLYAVAEAVLRASGGSWRIDTGSRHEASIRIEVCDGPRPLTLEFAPLAENLPRYKVVDGVACSYCSASPLDSSALAVVDRVMREVAPLVLPALGVAGDHPPAADAAPPGPARTALSSKAPASDRRTAAGSPGPSKGGLRVTFLGHQGWHIAWGRTNILIDPLLQERFGRDLDSTPASVFPPRRIDLSRAPRFDAVIVTHEHEDHFDFGTIDALDRDVPIYLSDRSSNAARTVLHEMGFTLRLLTPGHTSMLGELRLRPFVHHWGWEHPGEWELLPFAVFDPAGDGSFFTSVDLKPEWETLAELRRLGVAPGLVTYADNFLELSPMCPWVAPGRDRAAALAQELRSFWDTTVRGNAPPEQVLVCGNGYRLHGELEVLNPVVFRRVSAEACAAANERMGRPVFQRPEPGETWLMKGGQVTARASSSEWITTTSRASSSGDAVVVDPGPFALGPATRRTRLDSRDRSRLPHALAGFARYLYGSPLFTDLLETAPRKRETTLALALLEGEDAGDGLERPPSVWEWDRGGCRFVSSAVDRPEERYVVGLRAWASDMLDVLTGDLPASSLYMGRLRAWNAAPDTIRTDLFQLLFRYAHPLHMPAEFLAAYRRLAGLAPAPPGRAVLAGPK